MNTPSRHVPLLKNVGFRTAIGLFLLILASAAYLHMATGEQSSAVPVIFLLSWIFSVLLTDKYRHKYPQRYYSYVLAAHGKAAVMMLVFAVPLWLLYGMHEDWLHIGVTFFAFTLFDLMISIPRRKVSMEDETGIKTEKKETGPEFSLIEVNTPSILDQLKEITRKQECPELFRIVQSILKECAGSEDSVAVLDDACSQQPAASIVPAAFVLLTEPINQLRRLNKFLQYATEHTHMGGYFVFRYSAMDDVLEKLALEKGGLSFYIAYLKHFLWYRALPKIPIIEKLYFVAPFRWIDHWLYPRTKSKRRMISRAEMWGRMYYHGYEVLHEERVGNEYYVVTRKVRLPERERTPSFFLVVKLTKVGLDGKMMQLHKLRTMYPFSEFIQEKLYNEHGLLNTGKFKNDFRLTDYGRFFRKYWLDEVPQIFDWLRGDIKLVGMRATSPHFLSLYPKELYDLYIETKPGLIPPIFDASTTGFEDIVRTEMGYLLAYKENPLRADAVCFFRTFRDIVFRGVRSK